jgi:hypothetical protein
VLMVEDLPAVSSSKRNKLLVRADGLACGGLRHPTFQRIFG